MALMMAAIPNKHPATLTFIETEYWILDFFLMGKALDPVATEPVRVS
jgi:hypothetical protein